MLTMFTGVSLEYEVQLVLRAEDVQGARLDETAAAGGWAGTVSWSPRRSGMTAATSATRYTHHKRIRT
jgi:predicted component of type VI protein secretion system